VEWRSRDPVEERVERLVLEYALNQTEAGALDKRLSLHDDLGIESVALVSLAVRLGEELGFDVVELGLDLGDLKTLGDLTRFAKSLARSQGPSLAAGGARIRRTALF
jgi:acyl carrier protein